MEIDDTHPFKASPNTYHSSPSPTPDSSSGAHSLWQARRSSPTYKRMGLSISAETPPLEFIEPIGQGPQFHFTRPRTQSRNGSSRPSTSSSRAVASTRRDLEDGVTSDEEEDQEIVRPLRRVERVEFVLEGLDSDPGYDSNLDVVRPDHYEDAKSDVEETSENVDHSADLLELEEESRDQERTYREKKRWSAGIFKRMHAQSVEGDNSYSDNDPLDDIDSSARRLRRRIRGPGDKASLMFEDGGFANTSSVVGVEEPNYGMIPYPKGPPSIPSDDGFRLDELPFWYAVEDLEGEIEVENEYKEASELSMENLKSAPKQFTNEPSEQGSLRQEDIGKIREEIFAHDFQGTFEQQKPTTAQVTMNEPRSDSYKASAWGGTTVGGLDSILTGDTLAHTNTTEAKNEFSTPDHSISERERYDDDIRSLLSYDGNDSQAPIPDTGRRNEIENAIVSILATNPAMTPLYEKALQLMPKARFVNNLRRLLKVFRNDLAKINGNLVTQELAALLRPKPVLERIARQVTARQISPGDPLSEEDLSHFQEPDKSNLSYLEGWLAKGKFPPLDNLEDPDMDQRERLINNEEGGSSDGSESDDNEQSRINHSKSSEMARFPRLDLVIQALVEGRPFQDMLIGLKEFLLPYGLLNELLPIPREHITFNSHRICAPVNRIQGFLENITSVEWDWWPLSPRMRSLNDDEVRVYWQCACGTVRWREMRSGQKEILEDLLKKRPTKLLHPPICNMLKRSSTKCGLYPKALRGFRQVSGKMSSSTSSAEKKYTPTPEGSRSSTNHVSRSPPESSDNPTQLTLEVPLAGQVIAQNSSGLNKRLRVIFGVEGPRITPELDQITDDDLQSDLMFLQKLRRRHRQLRGWLLTYFSFWRLSYWEFVKFEKILLQPGRVVVQKVDLPDSSDYEYAPRPPDVTAEYPGISRHEFEIIVQSCITPCLLASMPNLHDCLYVEKSATHIISRLPKKNKEFTINDQDPRDRYFWGIQARYVVSAVRVVIIHAIILGVSFGTWIWWQRKHPDDLQGASVPITVAGILMSTFWSSTGVLKGLR